MTSTNLHTLVHIGAGAGNQLAEYQRLKLQKLVLIEPLPTQAKELRRLTADMPNAEVWELAVSCQANNQPATLTEYNLAQASSLHPATGLSQLFPGIKAVQQHQVTTITPQTLIERLQLNPEQTNQLVVEANGEELAILDSLLEQDQLSLFRHIQVSMPDIALYQSPHNPGELLPKLEDHCFDLLEVDNSDPDLPLWQLALNPTKQQLKVALQTLQQTQKAHQATADENKTQEQKLKKLAQELADSQTLQEQLQSSLDKASDEKNQAEQLVDKQAQQIAELKEELTKYKGYFANRKKQHEEAEETIAELKKNLADNNSLVNELRQQLQATQNSEAKLNSLEQKMEALLNNQSQQIHQNTNALGQHITKTLYNSTRQLEALMGVQQSLQYGDAPLSYNGWAIGADLALQLVQQIQQHNYDMIIEFGSGTSTLLLAKALLNKSINIPLQRHTLEHKRNGTAVGEYIEPTEQDLPQRIVSFEHDKHYYKQTLQNLRQQGLAQVVELIHAPLVDYSEQGSDYLFYDCKGKIKQLAQTLAGREAHILVLVDGPSSTQEQENARYPALPHLLKHLAAHKLDIILDDYHRGGEQQIAEQWRGQLKARSLHFTEASLPSEKGALLLNINH
ncbi:hypothetical protein [Zobellella denitrificans]